MTDISTWVRDRVSADVDLDRPAMRELAHEIVREETLWRMGHYEPGPRGMRRTGITYADELLDVV